METNDVKEWMMLQPQIDPIDLIEPFSGVIILGLLARFRLQPFVCLN